MKKRKKKMGRPPKPPAEKFSKRVRVNLRPREYETLKREAERQGISMAELLARLWRERGSK